LCFEPGEHGIEGVGEFAELVSRSFDGIGHRTEGDRRLAADGGKASREVYVEWRRGDL
jgi:hypothetical protein